MAVSKRRRFEILRRDNHCCRYCGAKAPDVTITVDHVVPEALGGSDDPSNLVAACADCNSGKSSVSADAALVADVATDALRWARAMEQAAHLDRQKRIDDQTFAAEFARRIQAILEADPYEKTYCVPDMESPAVGGPDGFRRTVIQFRDCGLDLDDLERAVRRASTNRAISDQDNWKYFCGICWRMIRDRQDVAHSLLTAEAVDG